MDLKLTVREVTKSASRALSAVFTKFLSCGGMSYDVYNKLYKTLVEPVLFYGAGIWGQTMRREVQIIQNKACRLFTGCSSNSSNIALRGDMGYHSTKSIGLVESFRLLLRVRFSDDSRLTNKLHVWSMNISRSWDKRCFDIARKLNIENVIDNNYSNKCKMFDIKKRLYETDEVEWLNELFNDRNNPNGNKLRTYRLHKNSFETSMYLKNVHNRQYRRVLSNFRCGSLPLQIETGRYTKPKTPVDERLCKYCSANVIEDEKHFLLSCEFYSDLRLDLFIKMEQFLENFDRLDSDDKFLTLMVNENIQPTLAKILHSMFYRRKYCVLE